MSLEARLEAYVELIRKWSPKLDLVAPGDLARLHERHVEDSLKALPLLREAPEGPAVDVGSGAGLPGIPLALASPDRHWRFLEPRHRRAGFLEEAIRVLQLDAEVVALSAQEAAADLSLRHAHTVLTARALAPPEEALALLRPLAAPGARGVVWIGKGTLLPSDAEETVPGLASVTF